MRLTLAVLLGFTLGVGVSAVGAQLSMYGVDLNTQNEIDHWALIQEELRQPDIPLPKWTPPSIPARPCDR